MKTTIAALTVLLLAGCVTQANLVSQDGKRYPMEFNSMGRTVTTDIEGVRYSGIYAPKSSDSVGMVGGKAIVMSGDSSAGQAMLSASNGDFMNCDFMVSGRRVLGQCKGKNGRDYTLTTE